MKRLTYVSGWKSTRGRPCTSHITNIAMKLTSNIHQNKLPIINLQKIILFHRMQKCLVTKGLLTRWTHFTIIARIMYHTAVRTTTHHRVESSDSKQRCVTPNNLLVHNLWPKFYAFKCKNWGLSATNLFHSIYMKLCTSFWLHKFHDNINSYSRY